MLFYIPALFDHCHKIALSMSSIHHSNISFDFQAKQIVVNQRTTYPGRLRWLGKKTSPVQVFCKTSTSKTRLEIGWEFVPCKFSFSTDQQKGPCELHGDQQKNLYNWINQWLQSSRIIHSKFLGNFWCLNLFNHVLDRSFLSETALLGWDSCGGNWSSAPAIDAKPGSKTRRSINNLSLHGYDDIVSFITHFKPKQTNFFMGFCKVSILSQIFFDDFFDQWRHSNHG